MRTLKFDLDQNNDNTSNSMLYSDAALEKTVSLIMLTFVNIAGVLNDFRITPT